MYGSQERLHFAPCIAQCLRNWNSTSACNPDGDASLHSVQRPIEQAEVDAAEVGAMIDVNKAIEMLCCAEVNCDNVARLGSVGVQLVKAQIQDAIKELEGEIVTEDVLAPYREKESEAK